MIYKTEFVTYYKLC